MGKAAAGMATALSALLLAATVFPHGAMAQAPNPCLLFSCPPPTASPPPGNETRVDGRIPWPAWAIWGLAGAVVLYAYLWVLNRFSLVTSFKSWVRSRRHVAAEKDARAQSRR